MRRENGSKRRRSNRLTRFRLPDEMANFSGHRATRAQVEEFLKHLDDLKRRYLNTPSYDTCRETVRYQSERVISEYAAANGILPDAILFDADITVDLPPRQHFKLLAALSEANLDVQEGWYRPMAETWRSDIPVRVTMNQLGVLEDVLGKFTDDARTSLKFGGFKLP
jgi:hypothetical protein